MSDDLKRYYVPSGEGVEEHPAGLLYSRLDVDTRIEALTAERDALIAAALKEAERRVRYYERILPRADQGGYGLGRKEAADTVAALTPDDAIAAHERAIKDAVQAERERCAKVAEAIPNGAHPSDYAAAIRARTEGEG